MNTTVRSTFQFIDFLVVESHLSLRRADEYDFQLSIIPSGEIHSSTGQFELRLQVEATDANQQAEIKVVTLATFTYANIPEPQSSKFLTENAPAIVFPYIRAYISTLTTQAGIDPIVLPTMNLSGMADLLQQHIVVNS
ncbi:protein-export chaperone SecB [Fibrella sp. WM1]|uniref:protein-export chaperone SecB n=1 Tax=Fibrella musci TaxID=3242485 RepID=UPI00352201DD